MLKQSNFEELLDERNTLRSELITKDSLIEELSKENEVKMFNYNVYIQVV